MKSLENYNEGAHWKKLKVVNDNEEAIRISQTFFKQDSNSYCTFTTYFVMQPTPLNSGHVNTPINAANWVIQPLWLGPHVIMRGRLY